MEDDSLPEDCDITVSRVNIRVNQSECICTQPTATGDTDDIASPLSRSSSSLSLPPSSSSSDTHTFPLHHPHHHHPPNPGNHLSSTSPAPHRTDPTQFRADPAHIKEAAGDDLCLWCVLSCLFCELMSMCSALEACLTCPGGRAICCCEAICCCCSVEAEGMACVGAACHALVDCGIVEDCCSSNDLLDFCLECCSFFFPT